MGPLHPFKDGGVVTDSLTGIHSGMVNCLFVVSRSVVVLLRILTVLCKMFSTPI
jgi:hypothetical protein